MAPSSGPAPAKRLRGEILAAQGLFAEAVRVLEASIQLAEIIQTPREIWLGKAALGKVLVRLGREQDAEAHLIQAAHTLEAIADKLKTPHLRCSVLKAERVVGIDRTLGQRPPPALP